MKKVSSILTVFTMLILLGAATIPVFAQEGNPESGPSAQGPSELIVQPFQGTNDLTEASLAIPAAALNAHPMGSANPESVIGADGRTKINVTTNYPNRAIAHLVMTFPNAQVYTCTGWFVGPNDVATAAHCIYSSADGGYATNIDVYAGRNGGTAVGATTMSNRWVAPGWLTMGNPPNDYGLIQTTDPLGDTVGWFGFIWQSSNSFPGTYTVRGYPGDKTLGTMWSMNGLIIAVSGSRLWYRIDTFGGQSGSPLYKKVNNVCCYGFGIHTYGTSVSPYFGNSATRITQTVFKKLKLWSNQP